MHYKTAVYRLVNGGITHNNSKCQKKNKILVLERLHTSVNALIN